MTYAYCVLVPFRICALYRLSSEIYSLVESESESATVYLDLSCFMLVLQKRQEERVACVIHFARTQQF